MDREQFWSVIDKASGSREPESAIAEELGKLEPEEIASYQQHFDALFDEAYRWDLWGAAYLLEGGCSDDGFIDFRYGLISKGRRVFESALANPDTLADIEEAENISNELFGYVATQVYENKTGQQIQRDASHGVADPAGEEWDFDDQEECNRRLPVLSAKYGFFGEPADRTDVPPASDRKPWWKFW